MIGVGNSPQIFLNSDLYFIAIFADALPDQGRLTVEGLFSTTAMSPVLNFDGATLATLGSGSSITTWANATGLLGPTYAATAYNAPKAIAVASAVTTVAYPPFAMTANSCSPGSGTYIASASSTVSGGSEAPWYAYDSSTTASDWTVSAASFYNNGVPTATVRVMSVVPSRYWPPESTR